MKTVILILFAAIAALVAAAVLVWRREIASIRTLRRVGGNKYLYTMEYKARYDLDDLVSRDIDNNNAMLNYIVGRIGKGLIHLKVKSSQATPNCTSFQARRKDGEGYYFGRNYDYCKNPSLITVSRPKNGYASISGCDMSMFGYSLEKLPEKFLSKVLCLAAIYVPMDGINEKGFCISIMAMPDMAATQNTGRHKVGTATIMRLMLDRCATVDEALELLSGLDMCHDTKSGTGYHYLVADANGDSAVIEFDMEDGWKTMVTRKSGDAEFFLVTNHLLAPKYYTEEPDEKVGNIHSKSWMRYGKAREYLTARNGTVTLEEAQECLANVHWKELIWDNGMVESTQYSAVYDQKNIRLHLRSWSDYDKTETFSL